MGLAAWDVATLFLTYNITYFNRLHRWEGWNPGLSVIVVSWLAASYLLGRYSPSSHQGKNDSLNRVLQTIGAAGAVIVVFIGHSWLYQVIDAQTRFRGFLIPLVTGASVLSTCGQVVTARLQNRESWWILVGKRSDLEVVKKELEREGGTLIRRTRMVEVKEAVELVERSGVKTGIAIGNIEEGEWRLIDRILKAREIGRTVVPLCSWCEKELQRIPPELVNSAWLVQAEGFELRAGSLNWRIKRFSDVVGAILLMVVTAPIVLGAGLLIWLEDRGPVIYSQVRTGLNGKRVRISKLRSMKQDSEQDGAQWAKRADSRITRVGKILRATRIDELPQLVNVLNGDLSLIGPRPERPEIEVRLEEEIPHYRLRHWVRPGLSGWAQVSYQYGASIEDSRMKLAYDLYYLRNAGILLDILILIKTIKLVTRAEGSSPVEKK